MPLSTEKIEQIRKDAEKELWLPIKGYEKSYEVSNFGNVRSLDRFYMNVTSGRCLLKGVALKGNTDKKGYRRASLNGVLYLIHRLVAIAFIPNPERKPQINHIDKNPSNNHHYNLEWCTPKENMGHFYKNYYHLMKRAVQKGEKNNFSKLTNDDVINIRQSSLPASELAVIFGCCKTNIMYIKNRKTWAHL